jgi:hypothetical protein
MGTFIHRCNTAEGPRYREWCSLPEQYATAPMTRAEMAAYLFHEGGPPRGPYAHDSYTAAIEARLVRADIAGTSATNDTHDMSAWDVERCNDCGGFHHKYQPRRNGLCRRCGESAAACDRESCGATPGG